MIQRQLVKKTAPHGEQGFLGNGHIARRVVGGEFKVTDPFIFLMDDFLDKKDTIPVGGPHPHAGFETATFVLDGEIGDGEYKMNTGDFQLMTAGSGVIHTETIDKESKMRILQLWLNLPREARNAPPRLQHLSSQRVPTKTTESVTTKVYSGEFGGLHSPLQNYTPFILADITLKDGSTLIEHLPANFNSFLYVLKGSVSVGSTNVEIKQDEVGWLDLHSSTDLSELTLKASNDTRIVLYAGKQTNDSIVSQGPFIAGTAAEIKKLFADYWAGKMDHIMEVSANQRMIV